MVCGYAIWPVALYVEGETFDRFWLDFYIFVSVDEVPVLATATQQKLLQTRIIANREDLNFKTLYNLEWVSLKDTNLFLVCDTDETVTPTDIKDLTTLWMLFMYQLEVFAVKDVVRMLRVLNEDQIRFVSLGKAYILDELSGRCI